APKVERDRALEDWEIPLFWKACDKIGWPFGPLFQLLLLLGPRRDELAWAPWPEFDFTKQVWNLPADRAKNERALITHLPQLACDILGALPIIANPTRYVFCSGRGGRGNPVSGFGRAADQVEHEMQKLAAGKGLPEIDHFTRHDLRRAQATG